MRPRLLAIPRLIALACIGSALACSTPVADERYFGKVTPPEGQVFRYITGGEPESLDPQIGTGQPEARIYLALFEGLTEFDPRTGEAIPGLAERWDVNGDNTEFVFHLRPNARWSDGSPITAADVVYGLRRGLTPATASRNAYMGYDIAYAEAFNSRAAFVRDPRSGQYVSDPANPAWRLVVPGDAADRDKGLSPDIKALIEGKALELVRAEDLGVEALDEHTVRFRTLRPVPFFPGLLGHQFFRLVPRQAIEQHGDAWTRPGHLVSSGAYVLEAWKPYDRIVTVRNPMYWDNASARLDRITFYPLEDQTTMMNLYKAGAVDATYNHTVPAGWVDNMRRVRDYMDAPENGNEFYYINIGVRPMDDVRVRRALNMAIDREALSHFRKTTTPLTGLVPKGIFRGYPNPEGPGFDPTRAKALLAEAGFRDASGAFDPAQFPVGEVEINYNTSESNRQVAEFVQAQWKQHLGLTIALKNSEFRTFIAARVRREYKGVARSGWAGDYMDPFTFLDLFSTAGGNNGSGWTDPRYVELLRLANGEADRQKRYDALARAEAILLEALPFVPLHTPATNWMKKPYVMGMYANPLTMHAWKYVYIEHDRSKWDQ